MNKGYIFVFAGALFFLSRPGRRIIEGLELLRSGQFSRIFGMKEVDT